MENNNNFEPQPGEVVRHKATGEKVVILQGPEFLQDSDNRFCSDAYKCRHYFNGEYKIAVFERLELMPAETSRPAEENENFYGMILQTMDAAAEAIKNFLGSSGAFNEFVNNQTAMMPFDLSKEKQEARKKFVSAVVLPALPALRQLQATITTIRDREGGNNV